MTTSKRVPRPKDMTGIPLLPSETVVFSEYMNGRGWGEVEVCAGRRGTYIEYATANVLRLPDFCGAMLVGCVRFDQKAFDPNNPQHAALPEIPNVPAELLAHFPNVMRRWGPNHIYPLIGLWHHIISHTHRRQGAALIQVADVITGPTMVRSLEAVKFLQGRKLCHEVYSQDWNKREQAITSYRMLKPYVNYNSNATVSELNIRVTRTTTPGLWMDRGLDGVVCRLPKQPRMSANPSHFSSAYVYDMQSPIRIGQAPSPP